MMVPVNYQRPVAVSRRAPASRHRKPRRAQPAPPAAMRISPSPARAGVALIIVMICITVLSILAAGFAYSMKVETKLAMNANSESELNSLGRPAWKWRRWVLAQQSHDCAGAVSMR